MQDRETLLWKLKAVSDDNRFRLLEDLKDPKTINDLHLTPETENRGYREERCLTRQGIQYHIDILREAGLVTASPQKRDGRIMNVHRVDPSGLFLLEQELATFMSRLGQDQPPVDTETQSLPDREETQKWPEEPRLVLTRGLTPGRVFELGGKPPSAHRGWIIGRSAKVEITIPYDPYVSAEDTEILPEDGGFRVLDLRTSTNRTTINGRELSFGGEARLERGDLLQVGRTQLLYQGP